MTEGEGGHFDLGPVLARFPTDAMLIERLVAESEAFRTLCEEYALARSVLVRFEERPDSNTRPESPL